MEGVKVTVTIFTILTIPSQYWRSFQKTSVRQVQVTELYDDATQISLQITSRKKALCFGYV